MEIISYKCDSGCGTTGGGESFIQVAFTPVKSSPSWPSPPTSSYHLCRDCVRHVDNECRFYGRRS